MSELLAINFDWIDREVGDPIEKATLADITITVRRNCLTELEDQFAKTVRRSARLSAYALAKWLAWNWWRLRWEPERQSTSWEMSHNIGGAGEGYLWPDAAFVSDGGAVTVISRPTDARKYQPVRYLNHVVEMIPAIDFERATDRFVEAVIGRLESQTRDPNELKSLWEEVLRERRTPDLAAHRKIEAIMGCDPGEAPDELVEALEASQTIYGRSAVEEMAAASMEDAVSDIRKLWDEIRPNALNVHIPESDALRGEIQEKAPHSIFPWKRAAQAAEIAKKTWGLGSGPISSKVLGDLLGIHTRFLNSPDGMSSALMSAGFRDMPVEDLIKVHLNRRPSTSRRFALARLVGAFLETERSEKLLPASDAATQRQKFQRAFAQEFLCPYADLTSFLGEREPDDPLIEDAADYFDVSPLLIKTTLVNKKMLERWVMEIETDRPFMNTLKGGAPL